MEQQQVIQEYEPFGPEWVKEVKKLPKDFLIEQWKKSRLEIQRLKAAYQPPSSTSVQVEELDDEIRQILGHAFLGEDHGISRSSFDLAIREIVKYIQKISK